MDAPRSVVQGMVLTSVPSWVQMPNAILVLKGRPGGLSRTAAGPGRAISLRYLTITSHLHAGSTDEYYTPCLHSLLANENERVIFAVSVGRRPLYKRLVRIASLRSRMLIAWTQGLTTLANGNTQSHSRTAHDTNQST
jgi:hypothetical protein